MLEAHAPSHSAVSSGRKNNGEQSAPAQVTPTQTTGFYFHSQSVERLFPSPSTSYSKIAATLFSGDHLGDEL